MIKNEVLEEINRDVLNEHTETTSKMNMATTILKILKNSKYTQNDKGRNLIIDDIAKAFSNINPQKIVVTLVLGLFTIYILMGIYMVNPGEQSVIRRFGVIMDKTAYEWIHYSLPWPINKNEKVNVSEVRRADVGVSLAEHKHQDDSPQTIQLLTGDENIISTEAIVHYKIKDASKHLYNVNSNDERLIRNSIEAALVYLTASVGGDDILVNEKVRTQEVIMKKSSRYTRQL